MTYLAVPILCERPTQTQKAVRRAVELGAEMIELRLDYLIEPGVEAVEAIVKAARGCQKPVIATCRWHGEGGQFKGSEQERGKLLAGAIEAGADYVDIELACLDEFGELVSHLAPAKLILSNHDFSGLPADLNKRLESIKQHNPTVNKVIYTANCITESFAALDIAHAEAAAGRSIIAIGMGEAGMISRLLASKLGAYMTFASLKKGSQSAPGQISIEQIQDVFRWGEIDADTRLFGLVGFPVAHSMGPAVHNRAFRQIDYNGVYLPLLTEPNQKVFCGLLDSFRQRRWLDLGGLSVTIPHKQNALEYVNRNDGYLEPLARKIGSVNTLLFDDKGGIRGHNTDYAGALDAITSAMGIGREGLKNVPTAIIGAGGVGRALVAGLTDAGAKVTIYNRTVERGRGLAEEFNCEFAPLSRLQSLEAKLVINATSIGMHPDTDASALPATCIKKDMVLFDTVYNPIQTRLLQYAREAGATTIDGLSMFINQAAAQFELFTEEVAPRELMRQIAEKHLRPKK